MSIREAHSYMLNGKSDMLLNRGNEAVVLLERPRASSFPREKEGRVGNEGTLSARSCRHVRSGMGAKKRRMSRTDKETLQEMVETHRFELLQEWEQKVNRS